MNLLNIVIILIVFFDFSKSVLCFIDPITGITIIGSLLGTYMLYSKDNIVKENVKRVVKKIGQKIGYYEGCEDFWIPGNMRGLREDLLDNIYGQPMAIEMVVNAITEHLDNKNSGKPLTLSFHGDPGTGKSFVSKKIIKHMFREGKKTEYAHFFRGSIDFPSQNEIYKYKETLTKQIKDKIYECHRSVFVFDEVDKMPSRVLDVLSGFINQGKSGDYDYRRAIFILLSNVGSRVLYEEALESYANGLEREYMDKSYLSQLLSKVAYNTTGGLKNSALIRNVAISHYIPFLPLERDHVIKCLKKEVDKLNQIVSDELVEQVLQELRFIPDNDPVFADGGCKIVSEKVQFFVTRQQRRNKRKLYKY